MAVPVKKSRGYIAKNVLEKETVDIDEEAVQKHEKNVVKK